LIQIKASRRGRPSVFCGERNRGFAMPTETAVPLGHVITNTRLPDALHQQLAQAAREVLA